MELDGSSPDLQHWHILSPHIPSRALLVLAGRFSIVTSEATNSLVPWGSAVSIASNATAMGLSRNCTLHCATTIAESFSITK